MDSFTVGASLSEDIDLADLKIEILPDEILTIAVRTVSGTSTNATTAITWREEK